MRAKQEFDLIHLAGWIEVLKTKGKAAALNTCWTCHCYGLLALKCEDGKPYITDPNLNLSFASGLFRGCFLRGLWLWLGRENLTECIIKRVRSKCKGLAFASAWIRC